jgi:hypothetical protein
MTVNERTVIVKNYEDRRAEMRVYAESIPVSERAARYQALYNNMSVRKCVEKGLLPPGATSMGDWFILTCVLADLLGPAYIAADARAALIELGAGDLELSQNGL